MFLTTPKLEYLFWHGVHRKSHASRNGHISRHLLAWVRTRKGGGVIPKGVAVGLVWPFVLLKIFTNKTHAKLCLYLNQPL